METEHITRHPALNFQTERWRVIFKEWHLQSGYRRQSPPLDLQLCAERSHIVSQEIQSVFMVAKSD